MDIQEFCHSAYCILKTGQVMQKSLYQTDRHELLYQDAEGVYYVLGHDVFETEEAALEASLNKLTRTIDEAETLIHTVAGKLATLKGTHEQTA